MNIVLILVAYVLVICCHHIVFSRPPKIDISNGEDATDGEFPYMVQVRQETGCFFCGGSIIGAKWVLTAGHCLDDMYIGESGNYTIIYGITELFDCFTQTEDPETTVKVKTLHRHPDWLLNFLSGIASNDLGLLELEEDIPFSAFAQPISLAGEGNDSPTGELGNLTGWGSEVAGENPEKTLQKVQLPVLGNAECSAQIDHVHEGDGVSFNGTDFFCTDDQNKKGQCSGDSGSPYVINGTQYGIVSWSLKPCGCYPGTYTRVALPAHRRWIKEVTGI